MFYVYAYYNVKTNYIFYIGKGTGRRYKVLYDRNDLFTEYYNNNFCDVKILKYFDNDDEAFAYEQKMISEYKTKGQCSCNKDFGGLGGWQEFGQKKKENINQLITPWKQKNNEREWKKIIQWKKKKLWRKI